MFLDKDVPKIWANILENTCEGEEGVSSKVSFKNFIWVSSKLTLLFQTPRVTLFDNAFKRFASVISGN